MGPGSDLGPVGRELVGPNPRLPPMTARRPPTLAASGAAALTARGEVRPSSGFAASAGSPATARTQPLARSWAAVPAGFAAPAGAAAEGVSIRVRVHGQRQSLGHLNVVAKPLELDMPAAGTVVDLKRAIAAVLEVPIEQQRLFVRSCRLDDAKLLSTCGLTPDRPDVMLVPVLAHRHAGGVMPISARRGFHMVSGGTRWKPVGSAAMRHQDLKDFFGESTPDESGKAMRSQLADLLQNDPRAAAELSAFRLEGLPDSAAVSA
mmetsp:Transcript_57275/g.186221  ORF Transcript_57275/g.186221 Transcript_57275/m.186221 type:complete len:263 (-) Transcript_57275:93-881(-)